MTNLWLSTIAVAAGLSLGAAQSVRSAAMQTDPQPQATHDHSAPQADAGSASQADTAKMMGAMKANHEQLNALVTAMNAATGAAKVDAMAAVLTALVKEQDGMCAGMMKMHGEGMPMHQMMHSPAGGK